MQEKSVTKAELARQTGKSETYIYSLCYGKKPAPRPEFMAILSDAMECSKGERNTLMDYAMKRVTGSGSDYLNPTLIDEFYIPPAGVTMVPVLKRCPASRDLGWQSHDVESWLHVPQKFVRKRRMYLIPANDEGMTKASIDKTDLLLVHLDQKPKHGDIVIYFKSGAYSVRRLHQKTGIVTLSPESHNSLYQPFRLKKKTSTKCFRGVVERIHFKEIK